MLQVNLGHCGLNFLCISIMLLINSITRKLVGVPEELLSDGLQRNSVIFYLAHVGLQRGAPRRPPPFFLFRCEK